MLINTDMGTCAHTHTHSCGFAFLAYHKVIGVGEYRILGTDFLARHLTQQHSGASVSGSWYCAFWLAVVTDQPNIRVGSAKRRTFYSAA